MHLGVSSFLLLFCYYNAAVNIFCSFLCLRLKVLLWGKFPEMCCVYNRGYAFKIQIENVELPCIMTPRPFTAAHVYSLPPFSVPAEAEWSWNQFVGEFNAIWHFLKKQYSSCVRVRPGSVYLPACVWRVPRTRLSPSLHRSVCRCSGVLKAVWPRVVALVIGIFSTSVDSHFSSGFCLCI